MERSVATGGLRRTSPRPALPPGPYLVAGLGAAGFAAARALTGRAGTDVRVWDSAADDAQRERAATLRAAGVDVRLGGDGVEALGGVRTVVKSPGLPPRAPLLAAAGERGLEIVDELELGWRLVEAPTVAVTGTNGKSTVAALCKAVLAAHGLAPALAGNTEFGPPLSELSLGPAPRSLVAEVSSYQAQFSPALAVDGAILTNLAPDHLNWHPSMEAYGAAKSRLFLGEGRVVPVAALNSDFELGREIAAAVEGRGGLALRYGRRPPAAYRIRECRWDLREAEAAIETPGGPVRVSTRLPGFHNAENVAAVLALFDGLGLAREPTLAALAAMEPVPGRFEVVDVDRPFDVVVDRAYSAEALAETLATARAVVSRRGGRLLAVLGVIGRVGPLIGAEAGAAAREHSDHLVICGVSYRGEPPLVTLATVASGARAARGGGLEIVLDRRAAIARALALAGPGDLVAVLGRGPTGREATDARGGSRQLDDREVVRELA